MSSLISLYNKILLLFTLTLSAFNVRNVISTSIKMDFLPLADVRTDPIINPNCLSDHVHTFYGGAAIRPETTYEDLMATTQNSGNVEENKSLYWHPTAYSYNYDSLTYKKDDIWFSSAYYIWETDKAKAFPNGFKMVAGFGNDNTRANAECVGPSNCEKSNCSTNNDFFPTTACAELEVSMAFPTCWDGVSIDTDDHRSHVAYDLDGGEFGADCPASHPVKIPEIQLFFRIAPYDGGHHEFSDGTGNFHADYFSGWDEEFLQGVLDGCSNYSEAASPDAFCEDFLTFRDNKECGQKDDEEILSSLQWIQPDPPLDTNTITEEVIDNVDSLPRGGCTGDLITGKQNERRFMRSRSTKYNMKKFLRHARFNLDYN